MNWFHWFKQITLKYYYDQTTLKWLIASNNEIKMLYSLVASIFLYLIVSDLQSELEIKIGDRNSFCKLIFCEHKIFQSTLIKRSCR